MDSLKTLNHTLHAYFQWAGVAWFNLFWKKNKNFHVQENHVALLAWTFPPAISGGVYRPLSFARYWNEAGAKVSLFSGPLREDPSPSGISLIENLSQDIVIHRVLPENCLVPSYKWFPRINGGFVNGLSLARLAIRRMASQPPSVVVATGPTFQSFMAAFYVSRYFGAKLVLDYRDEWTECPFTFVDQGNVDRQWERRCLEAADAVIFTTLSQLRHNRQVFNAGSETKYHVVPNGWEPEDFEKNKHTDESGRKEDEVVFSFFGALEDHTPPEKFLKQIENVFFRRKDLKEKIKIQFIGKRSRKCEEQVKTFSFSENIIIGDQVSKKEANRLMCKTSGLLIFYSDLFKRYIPGKFYDYLAAGTPMFVLGNEGEVPDILTELKAGFLIPEGDDIALEGAIDRFLNSPERVKNSNIEQWLELHTRKNMANKFYRIISQLN